MGRRIAFDPARGRLWAICRRCKRWSLAPIEDRWEALDELEKLTRDKARLLSQTDNVSLLRAGPLEIVRVGQANLTEEAWWRYGRELTNRRKNFKRISAASSVAVGAAVWGGWATGGLGFFASWILWENAPRKITDAARWLRFGSTAWRGDEECARCGYNFRNITYRESGGLFLLPGDTGDKPTTLAYRCPRCSEVRNGGLHLEGKGGEQVLRRVMAHQHFAGASERRVISATRLIQEAGSPRDLARILVKDGRRLGDLKRTGAIALEISVNDDAERRLLEMEVAELEAHWRQEEELAEIVDGELTPMPLLESIRRKAVGIK